MTFLSGKFTHTTTIDRAAKKRTTFGVRRRSEAPTQYERNERYGRTDYCGSHMPIDTGIHWEWRNPLNILPALLLLLLAMALVAMVWA